jgi:hypothetical protein
MVRRTMTPLCFVAICVVVSITGAAPEQKQLFSGQVLDSNDKAIPNVRVRLKRGSDPTIEDKSKSDGTYSISFSHGKPIDRVEYELTGWDGAFISGLSGARDHTINKTLYPASSGGTDPAEVDPRHYKVEFENESVRVLRWTVGPREKTPILEHPANLWIPLTNLDVKGFSPDGRTEDFQWEAGHTIWRAPTIKAFENVSDRPFESIIVELKTKPSDTKSIPK